MRDPKKQRVMTETQRKRYLTRGTETACTLCRGEIVQGQVYISKPSGKGGYRTKLFCERHIEADSLPTRQVRAR